MTLNQSGRVAASAAIGLAVFAAVVLRPAAQAGLPSTPDAPFKLATFETGGKTRLGMVLGVRVLDLDAANQHVAKQARLSMISMPADMRTLIEQYATLAPRLYQIANYFKANASDTLPFGFDLDKVTVKAPISYPWNVLAAAANYKAHAEGMAGNTVPASAAAAAPPRPGFDASVISRIVPERDAPIMFAKSPRSSIIGPDEPFYIVGGRERTDYEGEMVIVMGPRPAYRVPREQAHDYVFGYSVMQDISDRGSERLREVSMFAGTNWFDGKSLDRAAPFGPVIVPKEFLPNAPGNLRIVTKLNGQVVQDGSTSQLIWGESHLIAYVTSRMTLYPGDVIMTGTPAGTGAERQRFLKAGDVVTVEIDGIGTLATPFKSLP